MNKIDEIEKIIVPVLNDLKFELVDIENCYENGKNILRIFIDKEGGITIDDCVSASEHIGFMLDNTNLFDKSYVLEVSSPGLDRKLKKESDYVKFCGKKVRIKLFAPINNQKNIVGTIKQCSSGIVTVTVSKIENKTKSDIDINLELSNIAIARLEPEINFK